MHSTSLIKRHAHAFAPIETRDIRFDPAFRADCERNACGYYGACWMCPPDVGDIETLIARAKSFEHAIVFQTVEQIADSFDIEGMHRAAKAHNHLIRRLKLAAERDGIDCMLLGAGACGGCSTCARVSGEPCRHPSRAVVSMEAAGVDVVELARKSGLAYLNGSNTVTFFGLMLLHDAVRI